MSFTNKVAIVTGGAQGLGKTFCIQLLGKGAKVCFCDNNKNKGLDSVRELRDRFGFNKVEFVHCDVTDARSLEDVFKKTQEKFGKIDILVNNAGVMSEGNWKRCISINLVAVIEGCKLAEKYMSKRNGGNGGSVLSIASIAGIVLPMSSLPVYGATKAGVIGLTRSLALRADELKTGIKYVSLCPGAMDTALFDKLTTTDGMTSYGINDIAPLKVDAKYIESPENVARAGIQLLETENNNGGVMTVIASQERKYIFGGPKASKI